jgi:hypothetical protein
LACFESAWGVMNSIQDGPLPALNVVDSTTDSPQPVEQNKRIDKSPLHSSKGNSPKGCFLQLVAEFSSAYRQ